jgi:hypothetical protein
MVLIEAVCGPGAKEGYRRRLGKSVHYTYVRWRGEEGNIERHGDYGALMHLEGYRYDN